MSPGFASEQTGFVSSRVFFCYTTGLKNNENIEIKTVSIEITINLLAKLSTLFAFSHHKLVDSSPTCLFTLSTSESKDTRADTWANALALVQTWLITNSCQFEG